MLRIALTALFSLAFLAGCSSSSDSAGGANNGGNNGQNQPLANTYTSPSCWKNKSASEGMGVAVYTKAVITLNADLSGNVNFDLYSDSVCASLLGSGQQILVYEVTKTVSGARVIKVTAHDASDPSQTNSYYLVMKSTSSGAFFHLDGTRTDSVGPYSSEPSDAELAVFAADPEHVGVLFTTAN